MNLLWKNCQDDHSCKDGNDNESKQNSADDRCQREQCNMKIYVKRWDTEW